jgi:superfamily II DNA helicase RecQ/superfamily I DNA/RNA helicase/tetratricopeptide (TPR) repeat protein
LIANSYGGGNGEKESIRRLIDEGQRLLKDRNYEDALNVFEQARILNDRDVKIYVGRGDCLYELHRYEEALAAYDRALIYDKKRANAYVGQGKCLHQLHYEEEAIEAFETAISYAQEPKYSRPRINAYRELCIVQIALKNYEEALDAYEEMKKLDQKRDVRLDAIPIKQRADRIENHIEAGSRLLESRDYEGALEHFQSALYFAPYEELEEGTQRTKTYYRTRFTEEDRCYLNTKLVHVYSGKGHTEFALQRSGDALQSYTQAEKLDTKDVLCFLRMGDLLSEQQDYDDASHYYDIASRLQPHDFAIQVQIGKKYFDLKNYESSLQAYNKALKILNRKKANGETVRNKKHLELLLMIGDLYTFFGKKDEAFAAYEKSLALIDTVDMGLHAWNLPCLSRPASVWLTLCKPLCAYIVKHNSYNTQVEQVLEKLGNVYTNLFDPLSVVKEVIDVHIAVLQEIFEPLPVNRREEALNIIAQHDEGKVAHLLTCLASARMLGFTTLVEDVMAAWQKLVVNKDLVYRFYRALPDYAIAQEQADLFLAQCLLHWGEYKQVQAVLTPHSQKSQPQPDSLWYISLALQQLEQDPEQQVALLRRFIALFSDDTRVDEAYKRIGDLYWERLHDGHGALAAYREAATRGATIPRLNQFRQGNWDEILRALPDYGFPPIVVIDIESEYDVNAPPGSLVFEVAAVRVKGNTELDAYQAVIQREFVAKKVADRQGEAKPQEVVTRELQAFINATSTPQRPTIIVGHNLRSFDARHLRAMGITIPEEQIIDTLELARLLYPDSLHHHLALLCDVHGIVAQGDYHRALPDARACGRLLHVLGDEFIRRGTRLLNGVRALVPPGSAFDRAILQPRRVPADPIIAWKLDPAPALPAVLAYAGNPTASPAMMEALQSKDNLFAECNDPYGAYTQHLPAHLKTVVTAGTRARLERMLSSASSLDDIFVLPNPQTLLCPSRLRQSIVKETDTRRKLTLFCLYQASHNHDAQTLYPLRLPSSEEEFRQLRQVLLASCCSSDMMHTSTCPALRIAEKSAVECRLLLATHETFLHQPRQPQGDVIVIDDINKLQMHFVSHLAAQLNSEQVQQWSGEVFDLLEQAIADYVADSGEHSVAHERIDLRYLAPYLRLPRERQETCLLARMKELGAVGRHVAQTVEELCTQAEQEAMPGFMHAYWLDIWFSHQARAAKDIERWQFNGLHCNVHDEFRARFWSPYTQHILCGTAVSLGKQKTRFIESFFGLHQGQDIQATLLVDALPPRKMYIPRSADEYKPGTVQLRPASFLGRRSWAESVGMFLYHLMKQPTAFLSTPDQPSLLITLHETAIADALACTMAEVFSPVQAPTKYRVLSPALGWTTAKIAERLVAPMQPTIAFVSPFARENSLDAKVNIEAIGPMRFLNQRDPLVAAHIHMFSHANSGIPMAEYLLPQAMLELKTRLASSADVHIILDSGLRSKIYWDEIEKLFENDEIIHPDMQLDESATQKSFADTLSTQLKQHGFGSQRAISSEELRRVLYTFWELKEFRKFPLDQEAIIQEVLAGNDQLVIAATGGGKSLCFQMPAILLAKESLPLVTLVISPLIALMTNQVEALRKKGIFSAIALNSSLPPEVRQSYLRGISQGDYSIIYAAPEQIRSSQFRDAMMKREIGLIAFDEAHCVSQWGHDFRTDYLVIKEWIEKRISGGAKRSFPLLALTATARKGHASANYHEQSTILDIIDQLGLQKDGKLLGEDDVQPVSPERTELLFKVIRIAVLCPKCKKTYLTEPANATPVCPQCGILPFSRKKEKGTYVFSECVYESKLKQLIALLDEKGEQGLRQRWDQQDKHVRQRGLIYCAYKKTTEQVAKALEKHPTLGGLKVAYYHGGMKTKKRDDVYQRFMRNELDIVVATNAFGMGIDVERLGFVIHFDVPGTLENYYQEAGRAGRDPSFKDGKQKAHCILLYHEEDLKKQRFLKEKNRITEQSIERVYDVLNRLRTGRESELVVSVADLALLAHVEDEQVKTILYYLERNTRINGEGVLARGENAGNNKRQLRFERGYQQRLSEQSLELLRIFQSPETQGVSSAFRLNEEYTTVINIDDLATDLQQNTLMISRKIQDLLNRHILVEASYSYVQWHKNQKDALEAINNFINDIQIFLRGIEQQDAYSQTHLWRKRIISVDVNALHKHYALKTPVDIFLNLIHHLAKVDAKKLQLFSHFQRATTSPVRGMYELSLKPTTLIDAEKVCQLLHTYLRMTIEKLALKVLPSNDEEKDTWHVIDKLNEVPDYSVDLSVAQRDRQRMEEYEKRDLLDAMLLMLDLLKILTLHNEDKDEYQEMLHIIFEQTGVTAEAMRDTIDIDLSKFRQVEYYNECKLEAMQAYADIPDGKYAQRFNDYFRGITPLITPFEICSELTEEQRAIVTLAEGYHRIDGPAGSGKTRVLEEHLEYLVESMLVPPERILVATHYGSAKYRIAHNSKDLRRRRKNIQVKTLNAFGDDIFKQYRALLIQPDGQPYYAEGAKLCLMKEQLAKQYALLREAKSLLCQGNTILASWPANLPSVRDFNRIDFQEIINDKGCLNFINRLREYGVFPVLHESAQDIQVVASSLNLSEQKMGVYYALYRTYFIVRARQDIYTYDDQILFALAILNANPQLARRYQRSFEHIIVDEYQDLTSAQVRLLLLLSKRHHHLMLFGDERQDIRPGKITSGVSLLYNAQRHYCTTNFRCVQGILTLAHAVLKDKSQPVQKTKSEQRDKKPGIIYVERRPSPASPDKSRQEGGDYTNLLKVMVDAALDCMGTLHSRDRKEVGFVVAKKEYLASVRTYIENEKKEYLEKKRIKYRIMKNEYTYQSSHMKHMLTYFRLICDGMQDKDLEELLCYCLTIPFEKNRIHALMALAQDNKMTVCAFLKDQSLRNSWCDDPEQAEILHKHLSLLERFGPDDNASQLWEAISALPAGPMELQKQQQKGEMKQDEQATEDDVKMRQELAGKTVQEFLAHAKSHISFLPTDSSDDDWVDLVLTTIDYAKSQEFTTVFLLGTDQLKNENRWYVAVTRARNRFFCLVDKDFDRNGSMIPTIRDYCAERTWTELESELYASYEYTSL